MPHDEDDVHQCGRCKQQFHNVDHYFAHKRAASCTKPLRNNVDVPCIDATVAKSGQYPAKSLTESDKLQGKDISETIDMSKQLEEHCKGGTKATIQITAITGEYLSAKKTLLADVAASTQQTKSTETKRKEKCNHCGYVASTIEGLDDHVRQKHTNLSFQCNVCSRSFRLQHHLQRHADSLHKPIAQLPDAMVTANVKDMLQKYGRRVIDLTKEVVRKDSSTTGAGDLNTSAVSGTKSGQSDCSAMGNGSSGSEKEFICFVCCVALSSPARFWRHLEHHRTWVPTAGGPFPTNLFNLGAPASQKVDAPVVECEVEMNELTRNNIETNCDRYQTIDREALSQLIQEHVGQPSEERGSMDAGPAILGLSTVATVCCMAGEQLSRMNGNSSSMHLTMADIENLEKISESSHPVRCPYCDWTADSMVDLYQHKMTSHMVCAHFRCIQCPRVFGDAFTYAAHRCIHEQHAFICDVCNAHFYKMASVFAHKSSAHRRAPKMSGSTAVQCKHCGEVYKGHASLLRHQAVHNVPQILYKCDKCSSEFGKREHRNRHMSSKHSNERPFVCAVSKCGREFKHADKLKRHERKVHAPGKVEKALTRPCPVAGCSRQFTRSDRLKRHLETEHRIEARWPIRCFRCKRGFTGVRSLRTHILKSHYGFSKKKLETVLPISSTRESDPPPTSTCNVPVPSSLKCVTSGANIASSTSSNSSVPSISYNMPRNEVVPSSSPATLCNSSSIVTSSPPSSSLPNDGPQMSILIARSTDNSICHTKVMITTSVAQHVVPPMNHLGEFKEQLVPCMTTAVPSSTSQIESTASTMFTANKTPLGSSQFSHLQVP